MRVRVLDAFAAWLKEGVTSRMDGAQLAQSPLVLAALHGLQVRRPFLSGSEVMHALISQAGGGGGGA